LESYWSKEAGGHSLEILDCGRASERTKGGFLLIFLEAGSPPFNWFLL
jgi:hypothetical protein